MIRAYVRGLTFVALVTGCPDGDAASGSADVGSSGVDDTHGAGATATMDTGSSGATVADGTASEAGTGSFTGIIDFGDGDRVSGGGHGGFDGWVAALAP